MGDSDNYNDMKRNPNRIKQFAIWIKQEERELLRQTEEKPTH